ncbi:hypothetical protein ACN091_10800, partial [Aliarcobacter butzleri]
FFSTQYIHHFHKTEDGAVNEALSKHITPSFFYHQNQKELNILDICFGIGYNTLSTIYYIHKDNLDIQKNIHTPG